jgi:N utilization substance protein A
MFDLKVINSVLNQLEKDRGIPREKALDAIEQALSSAYKKEYGKHGQIIRADFNQESGTVSFQQVKEVVDDSTVQLPDEDGGFDTDSDLDRFDSERHILIDDAQKIKGSAELGDEIAFPLEDKDDYGRISTQTAKQVIIQKIREAEKVSVYDEFAEKKGQIVNGTVQRFERGNLYIDLGRATGLMPYKEQIPGERFRQGERIRALLLDVDESSRGIFLKLSRSSANFLRRLFEMEAPEVASGVVELKRIAREAGSRSKIAVHSDDEYIDPVGACVGQRGVRVTTVMSALGNEKIDIIEWSGNDEIFVEKALSPAEVMRVELDEDTKEAHAYVMPDQQSLAIGKGGQNARLAAKLTGWTIDIRSLEGDDEESEITVDPDGSVDADEEAAPDTEEQIEASKTKDEASNREEAPKDTDSDTEEDTSEDTAVEADEETESDKEAFEEIEGEATEEEDDEEAKEKEE